ncbi:MAG: hypothetical protein ACOH2R_21360, partial [Pseudomonas sp.]
MNLSVELQSARLMVLGDNAGLFAGKPGSHRICWVTQTVIQPQSPVGDSMLPGKPLVSVTQP